MSKTTVTDIFEKMGDACALLLNGDMILGTTSGGGNQFLYASVNASDSEYWNSTISNEKAIELYDSATSVEVFE